jgi:starch synthase
VRDWRAADAPDPCDTGSTPDAGTLLRSSPVRAAPPNTGYRKRVAQRAARRCLALASFDFHQDNRRLSQRTLFVAAECVPLIETGGLADVVGALPVALRAHGLDVRLLLPGYPQVTAALRDARAVARIDALGELSPAELLRAALPNSAVPLYFVDCPQLYERAGGPCQDQDGTDWPDNALRFALLGRVTGWLAVHPVDDHWCADVLRLNDWHAALGAAYVRLSARLRSPVLFTVHNLAFQGVFDASWHARLGLAASMWSIDGVEFYGKLSFMKAGLQYADAISAASPTYARDPVRAPRHGPRGAACRAARRAVRGS